MLVIILANAVLAILVSDAQVFRIAAAGSTPTQLVSRWNTAMTWSAVRPFSPSTADSPLGSLLGVLEATFLAAFSLEMVLKLLAHGTRAYFACGWNRLDAIVIATGVVELTGAFGAASSAALILRLLRLLRPLRAVHRVPGMRMIFIAMLAALRDTVHAFVLLGFCCVLFAIIGVQSFAGKLRYGCHQRGLGGAWQATGDVCNPLCDFDPLTQQLLSPCLSFGNSTRGQGDQPWGYSCLPTQRCLCARSGNGDSPVCSWLDNPIEGLSTFDQMIGGALAFIQVISAQGWSTVIFDLQNSMGYGDAWISVYFVSAILIGNLIVASLFLAVLCDSFSVALTEQRVAHAGSSQQQQQAADASEGRIGGAGASVDASSDLNMVYSAGYFRLACRRIAHSPTFERIVIGAIILNVIELSMWWSTQTPTLELRHYGYVEPARFWMLTVVNATLTLFFAVEMLVKLAGCGVCSFFADTFNCFDLLVVLVSLIELFGYFAFESSTANDQSADRAEGSDWLTWVAALRALRILRAFRLLTASKRLSALASTLLASTRSVGYLALLLLLVASIFAILGLELFGGLSSRPERNFTSAAFPEVFEAYGIVTDDDELAPDFNFDTLGDSLLVVFAISSNENWGPILFDIALTQPSGASKYVAQAFFITLYCIGNLVLFNIFTAILLSNLQDSYREMDATRLKERLSASVQIQRHWRAKYARKMTHVMRLAKVHRTCRVHPSDNASHVETELTPAADSEPASAAPMPPTATRSLALSIFPSTHALLRGMPEEVTTKGSVPSMRTASSGKDNPSSGATPQSGVEWLPHAALVVRHRAFEPVVMALIIFSSIELALDWPGYPAHAAQRIVINVCDALVTVLFCVEAALRMSVYGLLVARFPPRPAYFRDKWCIFDFVVICASLVGWIAHVAGASAQSNVVAATRCIRLLRSLRPLRALRGHPGMRRVVGTLLEAVSAATALGVIALFATLIFALVGMHLFGGKLGYCLDPLHVELPYGSRVIPGESDGVADYFECAALPKYNLSLVDSLGTNLVDLENTRMFTEYPQWVQPDWGSFDDVPRAALALFHFAVTLWPVLALDLMDTNAHAKYTVPYRVSSEGAIGSYGALESHSRNVGAGAIYSFAWFLVGSCVLLSLLVSIILAEFSRISFLADGSAFMSAEQDAWVQAHQTMMHLEAIDSPLPPPGKWRRRAHALVTSVQFELTIAAVIILNVITMGMYVYDPGWDGAAPLTISITALSLVFVGVYVIEMVLKIAGLGVGGYIRSNWNRFDACVTLAGLFEPFAVATGYTLPVSPGLFRVARLLRIVRVLRLLRVLRSMRAMVNTLILSLPAMLNILVLLLLFLFTFSIVCEQLFWTMGRPPRSADSLAAWSIVHPHSNDSALEWLATKSPYASGSVIGRSINFYSFGSSLLTLTMTATLEAWVLDELLSPSWGANRLRCCSTCGPVVDGIALSSCGNSWEALPIFLVFEFLMPMVLSLLVGTLIETFQKVDSPDMGRVTFERLELFREAWALIAGREKERKRDVAAHGVGNNERRGSEAQGFDSAPSDSSRNSLSTFLGRFSRGKFMRSGEQSQLYQLPSSRMPDLILLLPQPLGLADAVPQPKRAELQSFIAELGVPDRGGCVHFHEVLVALASRVAGVQVPVCEVTCHRFKLYTTASLLLDFIQWC